MVYYLVGGAVRDILLGKHPTEFDLAFDGTADEFLREHGGRVQTVGKKTAVYIVAGREHSALVNGNLADDLANRDLTINALAMDENGILHALPQTFADLTDGILRHASLNSFTNDYARVLRAARFTATLEGFFIHPETLALMRKAASEQGYGEFAAERAGKECMKAFGGYRPGNFLRALAEAEALLPWFPPLAEACLVPAGPSEYHGNSTVFDHTCNVMDAVAYAQYTKNLPEKERALAVWMALCHDFGKIETDPEKWPHHIGHESRGLYAAESLAASLRLPAQWIKAARIAISLHMKAGQYRKLQRKKRVDMLHTLNVSGLFVPFYAMITADSHDETLAATMQNDMRAMLAVSLPEKWRDKGEESAKRLRELRIAALPRKYSAP
ncbi:MAG: Multifunctional CCA protein [Desulfovibrio sp.]